jgi:8-oxo-dGTP pyrophosphatase MutT (NUDIX family)
VADTNVPDVPVRPASTVLALRKITGGFEVLMVRRARGAEFMGDAFVFPGGAVDAADEGRLAASAVSWSGDPEEFAWRAAALRELAEEAGLALTTPPVAVAGKDEDVYRSVLAAGARFDADRLEYLSNWVTPAGSPRRYDTRFYVTEVSGDPAAQADAIEVFDETWVRPAAALDHAAAGRWNVPFPTLRHLELLAGFAEPSDVLEHARALEAVPRVLPQLVIDNNGGYRVLLPGDAGFIEGADQ